MKYRQRMKDAIWSAAPNFGLIVAGGDPITMAISLASQVGIGYMNYRKTKAENGLDYEEQKWKLQKTPIEQLNGLQRELLDTAWRLADDKSFLFDTDILFTATSILIVERGSLKEICSYDSVDFDVKTNKLMIGSMNYRNNNVDAVKMNEALVELKHSSNKR